MPPRFMQPLRIAVQSAFLIGFVLLGIRFYRFVEAVTLYGGTSGAVRPDGIDGFLPISGLLGTSLWVKGGGINPVHPAAVTMFCTVIVISLLLRRSFCSWICPVAALSEWSWKGGFRLMKRNMRLPVWLDRLLRGVKYLLLAFFVYSIGIAMSPQALTAFIYSDYHKLADVRLMNFFLHPSPAAVATIGVVAVLSLLMRNPLCRYLCPYGALLGLAALMSPLRVTRDRERCVSCGVCSQVCPTGIDVMHADTVASPECIACWRCISHCRVSEALTMGVVIRRTTVSGVIFAVMLLLLFRGGIAVGTAFGHWHSAVSPAEYAHLLKRN